MTFDMKSKENGVAAAKVICNIRLRFQHSFNIKETIQIQHPKNPATRRGVFFVWGGGGFDATVLPPESQNYREIDSD